jgi:hypothetical protein
VDDVVSMAKIVEKIHEVSNVGPAPTEELWAFIDNMVFECDNYDALVVRICWAILNQEKGINPRKSTMIEMAKCKCSMKDCSNGAVPVVAGKALCEQCLMLITTLPAKSILTRVKKLQQEAVGLVHNIMHAVMKDDAT